MSASLFDFGLYAFHNSRALLDKGSGPYFYLPKLENRHEAELWAKVFAFTEEKLDIPSGSIKCTVLIEHLNAAFQVNFFEYLKFWKKISFFWPQGNVFKDIKC